MTERAKPFDVDFDLEDFTITVRETAYVLRYDFAAFRIYEKHTGQDAFAPGFKLDGDNLDTFLWAGLRYRSPELTIEEVQTWITPANAYQLISYIREAYWAGFPVPDDLPEHGQKGAPADPPSA